MSYARVQLGKAFSTRYVIERELGSGATARVYRARDRRHDRPVAIKVLRPELATLLGPERFLNEIRVTARLNHPNIVPLYDSGEADGLLYYVMPVIEGESLRQKLDREGLLSITDAVSIAQAIASALAYAHGHEVVHRDIKPENILLHEGTPLVADFGIAAAIQRIGGQRLTATGISLGTPAYMSPEQAVSDRPAAPASDIYSLGTLLYEMLTGDPPFTGSNVQAILARLQHEKPTPLRTLRENVPAGIDAAVARALAKVPGDRFATAGEFASALGKGLPPGATSASDGVRVSETGAVRLPLLAELKKRRVFRVALAYGGVGFVILQGSPPIVNALLLPEWVDRLIALLVLAGFPIALAFSWAFELTADGELRLERKPAPGSKKPAFPLIWRWGIGSAAAVAAIAGGLWLLPPNAAGVLNIGRGVLEPTRIVILPLPDSATGAGARDDDLLGDAFARWAGLDVVPPYRARERLTEPFAGAAAEQRAARSLDAGRYVRLDVARVGNRRRVAAALYDTRTGDRLAEHHLMHAAPGAPPDSLYDALATALLFRGHGFGSADADAVRGTRSYPAAVAFLTGGAALSEWNLDAAAVAFARALQLDPDFARAALWSAQTGNWQGAVPRDMEALIERAVSEPRQLSDYERRLAAGLRHLSRETFADACREYTAITDADGSDYAGWYGLGECHVRDQQVVAHPASPSGWRFRTSYHQGVIAYRQAFLMLPAGRSDFNTRTVDRLLQVLFTTTNKRRSGFSENSDVRRFVAHPSWDADTLALIPYPAADAGMGRSGRAPTIATAVERHRRILHEVTAVWTAAFPTSAYAWEATAVAQEIASAPDALKSLRHARSISRDSSLYAYIAAREVLLLTKLGIPSDTTALRRARALGDSLLRNVSESATPETLAVIAALLGRTHDAAVLLHNHAAATASHGDIRAALRTHAAVLLAYAALGGPPDSAYSYENQMVSAIRNRLPPEDHADAMYEHFALAASVGFPHGLLHGVLKLIPPETIYPLLNAQTALSMGDSAAARENLMQTAPVRQTMRPTERSLDALFPEAALWLALGDTATAVRLLDSTLTGLRWTEPGSFAFIERAACLVWAMALRADIAAATGDTATATLWAAPVSILWSAPDSELQHVPARMRRLLRN